MGDKEERRKDGLKAKVSRAAAPREVTAREAIRRAGSVIAVNLPDLDASAEGEIVADNVRATSAIYFAAQLEELKLFAVADRIAAQFSTGELAISHGAGADRLYRYLRRAHERLGEADRRRLYARVLGLPPPRGAADEPQANREFGDLWIRFLSAAHRAGSPALDAAGHKAARDLAVNLSLHGHGAAPLAVELQATIKEIIDMVGDPALLAAFGAHDRWQLVERVSALYLGGSESSVRHRAMADAGSRILVWLADNDKALAAPGGALTVQAIAGEVERWLAVAGG